MELFNKKTDSNGHGSLKTRSSKLNQVLARIRQTRAGGTRSDLAPSKVKEYLSRRTPLGTSAPLGTTASLHGFQNRLKSFIKHDPKGKVADVQNRIRAYVSKVSKIEQVKDKIAKALVSDTVLKMDDADMSTFILSNQEITDEQKVDRLKMAYARKYNLPRGTKKTEMSLKKKVLTGLLSNSKKIALGLGVCVAGSAFGAALLSGVLTTSFAGGVATAASIGSNLFGFTMEDVLPCMIQSASIDWGMNFVSKALRKNKGLSKIADYKILRNLKKYGGKYVPEWLTEATIEQITRNFITEGIKLGKGGLLSYAIGHGVSYSIKGSGALASAIWKKKGVLDKKLLSTVKSLSSVPKKMEKELQDMKDTPIEDSKKYERFNKILHKVVEEDLQEELKKEDTETEAEDTETEDEELKDIQRAMHPPRAFVTDTFDDDLKEEIEDKERKLGRKLTPDEIHDIREELESQQVRSSTPVRNDPIYEEQPKVRKPTFIAPIKVPPRQIQNRQTTATFLKSNAQVSSACAFATAAATLYFSGVTAPGLLSTLKPIMDISIVRRVLFSSVISSGLSKLLKYIPLEKIKEIELLQKQIPGLSGTQKDNAIMKFLSQVYGDLYTDDRINTMNEYDLVKALKEKGIKATKMDGLFTLRNRLRLVQMEMQSLTYGMILQDLTTKVITTGITLKASSELEQLYGDLSKSPVREEPTVTAGTPKRKGADQPLTMDDSELKERGVRDDDELEDDLEDDLDDEPQPEFDPYAPKVRDNSKFEVMSEEELADRGATDYTENEEPEHEFKVEPAVERAPRKVANLEQSVEGVARYDQMIGDIINSDTFEDITDVERDAYNLLIQDPSFQLNTMTPQLNGGNLSPKTPLELNTLVNAAQNAIQKANMHLAGVSSFSFNPTITNNIINTKEGMLAAGIDIDKGMEAALKIAAQQEELKREMERQEARQQKVSARLEARAQKSNVPSEEMFVDEQGNLVKQSDTVGMAKPVGGVSTVDKDQERASRMKELKDERERKQYERKQEKLKEILQRRMQKSQIVTDNVINLPEFTNEAKVTGSITPLSREEAKAQALKMLGVDDLSKVKEQNRQNEHKMREEAIKRAQEAVERAKVRLERRRANEIKSQPLVTMTENGQTMVFNEESLLKKQGINKEELKNLDYEMRPMLDTLAEVLIDRGASWIPGAGVYQSVRETIETARATANIYNILLTVTKMTSQDENVQWAAGFFGTVDTGLIPKLPALGSVIRETLGVQQSVINLKDEFVMSLARGVSQGLSKNEILMDFAKSVASREKIDATSDTSKQVYEAIQKFFG